MLYVYACVNHAPRRSPSSVTSQMRRIWVPEIVPGIYVCQRQLDLYTRELSLQEPVANYTTRGLNLYPQWDWRVPAWSFLELGDSRSRGILVVFGESFSLTYFVPLNSRRLVPIRVINSEPYTRDDIVLCTEYRRDSKALRSTWLFNQQIWSSALAAHAVFDIRRYHVWEQLLFINALRRGGYSVYYLTPHKSLPYWID